MAEPMPAGRLLDRGASERPDDEPRDPEAGHSEGDRDDEDAGNDAGHDIQEKEPEAGEHEPENVPQSPHGVD
jgi:hypothetical protein